MALPSGPPPPLCAYRLGAWMFTVSSTTSFSSPHGSRALKSGKSASRGPGRAPILPPRRPRIRKLQARHRPPYPRFRESPPHISSPIFGGIGISKRCYIFFFDVPLFDEVGIVSDCVFYDVAPRWACGACPSARFLRSFTGRSASCIYGVPKCRPPFTSRAKAKM